MTSSSNTRRLGSIDALRGGAALAVVATHINRGADVSVRRWLITLPIQWGAFGVHLFIVLSGFCIHNAVAARATTTGVLEVSWRRFWVRRFKRLYPAYWAAIAFTLLTYYVIGARPKHPIVSLPWDLGLHLLMLHNLTEFAGRLSNPPLWTLGIEEQLYALYAVYLVLRRKTSLRTTLLIVAAVSLGWQALTFGRADPELRWAETRVYWHGWPFFWWLLWVSGAVLAEARAGLVKLPKWLSSASLMLICGSVGALTSVPVLDKVVASDWFGVHLRGRAWLAEAGVLSDPAIGLASVVLLNRALLWDIQGVFARGLRSVGLFSYSLYLIHFLVQLTLDHWFGTGVSVLSVMIRFATAVPICVLLARGFFEFAEKPFLFVPVPRAVADGGARNVDHGRSI